MTKSKTTKKKKLGKVATLELKLKEARAACKEIRLQHEADITKHLHAVLSFHKRISDLETTVTNTELQLTKANRSLAAYSHIERDLEALLTSIRGGATNLKIKTIY